MLRARYLLVDGHSVIYALPDLRLLHDRQPRRAREELSRRLQLLHDASDWAVTLIFDGKFGTPPIPDKGGFLVRYSTAEQSADSMIEALVGAQRDRSTITVVTADLAERNAVEGLGAIALSPQWLEQELAQHQRDFKQRLEQVRRSAKW